MFKKMLANFSKSLIKNMGATMKMEFWMPNMKIQSDMVSNTYAICIAKDPWFYECIKYLGM